MNDKKSHLALFILKKGMILMLKINESVTITGESKVGDVTVVSMIGSITTDGTNYPNTSNTVLNQNLYSENIENCQADIEEFNKKVFAKQKEILGVKEVLINE